MEEPLKGPIKRVEQLKNDTPIGKSIKLYDIDYAIATYMEKIVVPTLIEGERKINVPVIYANPERWKSISKDGVLRDVNGQVQLPLLAFKRNSVSRDDSYGSSINRNLVHSTILKYSKKHKYDRFSQMNGFSRPVERYDVVVPDYVIISYDVIVWTEYTEQMNTILEAFQYATDTYWGDRDRYKFKVKIDSFDIDTELNEGSPRIVKGTFSMTVNGYLLPEKFNGENVIKKNITYKKITWGYETDLTGENIGSRISGEFDDVLNFMSMTENSPGEFLNPTTFSLKNVKVLSIPNELVTTFNTSDIFRVYINGVLIPKTDYTFIINNEIGTTTFTLLTTNITNTDLIRIIGKFHSI